MAGRWQRFIAGIVPGFLKGPLFGGFLESFGLTLDGATQSAMDGILASNPLTCEPDALPLISRDRRIRLYPTETEASKRRRLSQWKQIKRQAGMARGILANLQPYFLPGTLPTIRLVFQSGDGTFSVWYTMTPDGEIARHIQTPSNWDFDGVIWKVVNGVAGATNADPVEVTTGSSHDLITGQYVKIAGVVGNTAANGIWPVTVTDVDTFTVPIAGNGGYASGGTVAVNYRYRFWVIVETTGTRLDGTMPLYDDGGLYDGGELYDGVPAANAADMVGIINEVNRASACLWGLILTDNIAAFSPTGTSAVLSDGSTTLPTGNWGVLIDPVTHLPTRPTYASFYYDIGQA